MHCARMVKNYIILSNNYNNWQNQMTTDSIALSDVQTRPLEHKYIAEQFASTKLKNQKF